MNFNDISYHIPGSNSLAITSIFSSKECNKLIKLANKSNNWTSKNDYAQGTVDIEVDRVPIIRRWLRKCKLMILLQTIYKSLYNQTIVSFDDLFIVKYDANEQQGLILHTDSADISFMIALSDRQSYDGGGTYFPNLNDNNEVSNDNNYITNKIIHLNQGEMLTFDSDNYHQGLPITKGQRYLLVGFCYTSSKSKNSINNTGNINLKFKMIKKK